MKHAMRSSTSTNLHRPLILWEKQIVMTQTNHTPVFKSAQAPALIGKCAQLRAVPRKSVRLPAWIVFYRGNLQRHVAMVRDMTRQGMFFYSDFQPAVGEQIEFVLKFPRWTNTGVVACKGKVLRVEPALSHARTGVAVSLNRFMVLKLDESS